MKFIKYPSLTNHYAIMKNRAIFTIIEKEVGVSEKLHGANISIVFDKDGNVDYAKRSGFLTDAEKTTGMFQHLHTFVTENLNALKAIADLYWSDKDGIEQIHFYGELYGAGIQAMEYKENVEKTTGVRFFNVLLAMEDGSLIKTNTDVLVERFPENWVVPIKEKGILRLLIGDMDNVEAESRLGGPSEGDVYQPIEEYVIQPGQFLGIKHKRPEFMEKKQKVKPRKTENLTPEALLALTEVRARATRQRVENVLSHGEFVLEMKSFGPIIKAVQNDIVEEMKRENPEITTENVKRFVGRTGKDISGILREMVDEENERILGELTGND